MALPSSILLGSDGLIVGTMAAVVMLFVGWRVGEAEAEEAAEEEAVDVVVDVVVEEVVE